MMNKELSPYQLTGATFLAAKRFALLADDMGLGKTAQVITAADVIGAQKILVICPAVARVNWKREFLEWSIFSQDFKVCEKLKDSVTSRCIVSYDFATDNTEKLLQIDWDLIICDESHFIKEATAKRTQRIYGKDGIIRVSKRLWCLSGTPAPNHVGELWPMLYTFGAIPLSYENYVERFCDLRPTFYGGQRREKIVGTKNSAIPEIKKILAPIMLRRLKSEVLQDLPPVSYETLTVEGTPLADVIKLDVPTARKEAYALEYSLSQVSTEDEMAFVLEKLGNSFSTLRRYVGLQKVANLAEIISQELAAKAYEKIVIFAVHTDVIGQFKAALSDFGAVVVNGSVNAKDRQKAIDSFQTDPACKVFIGNILAAGTAITLTAAHQVLLAECSPVPGENKQAIDRVNRRGQTLPVTVRIAALADSLDEKITAIIKRKTNQLTQIFDEKSETHLIGE